MKSSLIIYSSSLLNPSLLSFIIRTHSLSLSLISHPCYFHNSCSSLSHSLHHLGNASSFGAFPSPSLFLSSLSLPSSSPFQNLLLLSPMSTAVVKRGLSILYPFRVRSLLNHLELNYPPPSPFLSSLSTNNLSCEWCK